MLNWHDIVRLDREGRLPRPNEDTVSGVGPRLVEVALCTSDQHGRFCDWPAWDAVLAVIDAANEQRLGFEIDRFIFNGDFTDFYELSKYPKDPAVEEPLDHDLIAFHRMIAGVRTRLGEGKPIDVNPGNHEYRYELYLRSDAKKLAGLKILELPALLKIEEYGATMHAKRGFMFGDTRVYHGELCSIHAAETAKKEMARWGSSGTSGHVHRLAKHMRTTTAGTMIWTESGCLCQLDAEYMTQDPNWQHGCVLLFRYDDGTVHQELVRILNGRVQGSLGLAVHGSTGSLPVGSAA